MTDVLAIVKAIGESLEGSKGPDEASTVIRGSRAIAAEAKPTPPTNKARPLAIPDRVRDHLGVGGRGGCVGGFVFVFFLGGWDTGIYLPVPCIHR